MERGSPEAEAPAPTSPVVGVFGGSFNPPHVAHVLAVVYSRLIAKLDRVLVIPVFQHPFAKELAPFEHRMAMCERAFVGQPWVEVSTLERDLGGESKTLRTLERLAELQPGWRLRLVLGSDVVPDLPKWHRFDRIRELADPLILPRRGFTEDDARAFLPEVSSTEVRRVLAGGDPSSIAALLPWNVLEYARKEGLYGLAK